MNSSSNADPRELQKFAAMASDWWDPKGPSGTLHDINACRLDFITHRHALHGTRILDVGCGGGILSEALARKGALVTGLDASPEVIAVARKHAELSGLSITYETQTAETFAARGDKTFDCIVCMELLEHVPDPEILLKALRDLARPGTDLFLSTLNRTPQAYLHAILGAEYVLRLLPVGTHDYRHFISPAELAAWLRGSDFQVQEICGMQYNPITRRACLIPMPKVNYLVHARRG